MNKVIIPVVCIAAGTAFGIWGIPRNGGERSPLVEAEGTSSNARISALGSGVEPVAVESVAGVLEDVKSAGLVRASVVMYERIKAMDAQALRELGAELFATPMQDHDEARVDAQAVFLARFAELDPEGALVFAQGIGSRYDRNVALGIVMAEIGRTDSRRAIAAARGIEEASDFEDVISTLAHLDSGALTADLVDLIHERKIEVGWNYGQMFVRWAGRDPAAAMAKIESLSRGERGEALRGIAKGLAGTASQATVDWIGGVVSAGERARFLEMLVGNVAAVDPQRAIRLIGDSESSELQSKMVTSVVRIWARRDPAATAKWIGSLPLDARFKAFGSGLEGLSREPEVMREMVGELPRSKRTTELVGGLVLQMSRKDPAAAAQWMDSFADITHSRHIKRELVEGWARTDPAAAAAYLAEQEMGGDEARMAGAVAGAWIVTDPDAAIAWMNGIEISDSNHSVMVTHAMGVWSRSDALAAGDYILQLEKGELHKDAVRSLMYGWINDDVGGARKWASGIEDAETREIALGIIVGNAAKSSPEEAAAGLVDLTRELSSEEAQTVLAKSAPNIATKLAANDPAAAARWLDGLPEFSNRQNAVAGIAYQWAGHDLPAATEWVEKIGRGEERDLAISGLINATERKDPAGAVAWANRVDDDVMREELLVNALPNYFIEDPHGARAALSSAKLSEETKGEIAEEFTATAEGH